MEEFLSSLGVGEALPAWLKELRVRQQEGRLQEASGISPPQLPRDPSANRPAEPPVDSPPVAVSTPGHVARGSESQAELPNPSFKEWLQSLDSNGFLVQYHDDIASKFDSVAQIVHIYAKDGVVDQQFFEDTSIKKLGGPEHRVALPMESFAANVEANPPFSKMMSMHVACDEMLQVGRSALCTSCPEILGVTIEPIAVEAPFLLLMPNVGLTPGAELSLNLTSSGPGAVFLLLSSEQFIDWIRAPPRLASGNLTWYIARRDDQ
ncbi:unnamed protein product [Effrenium voratum]|uniref:Uncharacterized protein n=1 Tax=Effrenium voratum TaxID=2562239 RepID=A0AA36N879_9DINO|nr:unnamed protein product [Effrenium voratum]